MISRCASEPPRRRQGPASAARSSAASEHRPAASRRSARARGATTSRWVGCVVRGGPLGQPAEAGPVVQRQQRDRAVHGEERRRRPLEDVAAGQGGDLLQPRHVGGVRGQRPAEQQRAGVHQRPAAEPVLGTELCVVPLPDGVEVAQRELVQRGVPREVAEAVDRGAVAGDPAVHPGETRQRGRRSRSGHVPARARSGRRRARRPATAQQSSIASSKRPCSWRTNASSPVNHQSSPYAGIARSTIDQASSGTSVTPANAIVGTAVERSSASRGYAARWATSGRESPVTWLATACTWLRSRSVPRAAWSDASRSRAAMSTSAQSSWPSSAREA